MDAVWQKLYNRALSARGYRELSGFVSAGQVAAALLDNKGDIYTGVCIDTASGLGLCAERNALAAMITKGGNMPRKIVVVMSDGSLGLPCGACREFIMQLSKNAGETQFLTHLTGETITLKELMPHWWGENRV